MEFDFHYEPTMLRWIRYVTHMAKRCDYECKLHAHGSCELIHLDYGRLVVEVEDTTFNLQPGDTLLIRGGHYHSLRSANGAPVDFLNIMFRGEVPDHITGRIFPVNRAIRDLILRLKSESEDDLQLGETYTYCCLLQLLIQLIRQEGIPLPHQVPEPEIRRRFHSDTIERALDIISRDYGTPLTLAAVSRAVGFSPSYFRTLLKQETGATFSELLQQERVKAAKYLLRQSPYSLAQIATSVGYQAQPFFFKVFKRWTGMTPMEYSRSLGDPAAD